MHPTLATNSGTLVNALLHHIENFSEDSEDSDDPNGLAGFSGVGAAHWVSGKTALAYAISFTNEPAATASAQQVVVTDMIDPNSDLNTLQLTSIGLVGIQVPISPTFLPAVGTNEFATNVDLRPAQNLLVNVDAKLDPASRILTWTFTSVDPNTGQLPLDASVGFLPHGASGNVFFTVNPKPGLPTGSQIIDQATIVFDTNAPMSTPVWINSIDDTAPVSSVGPLPAAVSPSFTVNWAGSDLGSGIQDFTIYVSDNGGPFIPFQTNTTATSAVFMGQTGHTYGFYSISRDLVGNTEPPKTAAEATTRAGSGIDDIPPITTVASSPQPNAAGWNNSNVTVTLTSNDNLGGSGVKQLIYSVAGAQSIPSTTVNGSSASFTISTEGISTITFFGTDNAGNVEAANTLTIRLDKTPPTITGARTPTANANGWNNSTVTVSFQCADTLSGLAAGSPPAPTILSREGAGQSVSGTCTDVAGNSVTSTVSGINIDKTPPTVACSASPNTLWPPNNKLMPVNVPVTVADSLSGSAGFNLVSVTSNEADSGQGDIQGFVSGAPSTSGQLRAQRLGSGTGRIYTFNYSGTDRAGNAASCTATVTVPHDQGK